VGDIVSVSTDVTYVGSTSVEVRFVVETFGLRGRRRVADGYFTFVNMAGGKPGEIKAAPRGDAAAFRRKEENLSETCQLKMLKPPEGDVPWLLQLLQVLDNDFKEPPGVVFQGGGVVEPLRIQPTDRLVPLYHVPQLFGYIFFVAYYNFLMRRIAGDPPLYVPEGVISGVIHYAVHINN
jgi:hypothetical protein